MPETCENRIDPVNSCVYYARQTREIYQVLPYSVDLKAPMELWNPMSKAVLSSFIWNKGPVNIWKYRKAQKYLYVGPVNIFPNYWHCGYQYLAITEVRSWVSINVFEYIFAEQTIFFNMAAGRDLARFGGTSSGNIDLALEQPSRWQSRAPVIEQARGL